MSSSVIHKGSSLKFDIKKGEVHFTQTEKYTINGTDDTSTDTFRGHCALDSDKLNSWLAEVARSWADGDSIRTDATAAED